MLVFSTVFTDIFQVFLAGTFYYLTMADESSTRYIILTE